MKINLISALFILIISASANAQSDFSFGFKGGLTLSNPTAESYYPNTVVESKGKTGFNIGGYIDIIKVNHFILSSDIYFTSKKAELTTTTTNYLGYSYKNNITQNVNYLIYGVSGKYKFDLKSIRPYIFAEPRLTFYLGDDITESSVPITQPYKEMISQRLKRFGFGLNLGAGMDFIFGSNYNIFAEAQFCPDLFYSYEDYNGKVKSNAFEFKIGCGF